MKWILCATGSTPNCWRSCSRARTWFLHAIHLMFVARNLERIADHTTNIAEDVIFLVRGVDVRHHATESKV